MWLLIVLFIGNTGISIVDTKVLPTKRECERRARLENKADFLKAFCVEYKMETSP